MKYKLLSGVEKNKEYPETFHIPEESEKLAIKVGSSAKLMFECNKLIERMWVTVTKIDYPNFEGTLDNDPVFLNSIAYGDEVKFHSDDIVNILE